MVGATRTRYISPTQRERRTSLSSTIIDIINKYLKVLLKFIIKTYTYVYKFFLINIFNNKFIFLIVTLLK